MNSSKIIQRKKNPTLIKSTYTITKEDEANDFYEIGIKLIYEKKYKYGFDYLKLAAYLKNISARYNLAVLYEFGLGTELSYKEAAKWYTSALEHEKSLSGLKRVIKKQKILLKQ